MLASEQVLSVVSESLDAFVYAKDREGRYLYINEPLADYMRTSREAAIGLTDADFFAPDQASEIRQNDLAVMRSGRSASLEEEGIATEDRPKGTWLSVKSPLRDESGAVIGVVGVTTDISKRKMQERAIADSEARLKRLLDQLFAFVGVLSVDGRMLHANGPPLALAGLTLEDVVGKPFEQTYWWAHDSEVQAQLCRAMEQAAKGETVRYDVPVRIADGAIIEIDFQIAPMRDADGHITELIPSGIDISDRKASERERELLLGEMKHRVKNTLAIVQNLARQTFRDLPGGEAHLETYEKRLLGLAAAQDEILQAHENAVSLESLLRNLIEQTCGGLARFNFEGPEIVLPASGVTALALAVHELCTNAMKYGALSNDCGEVVIRWSRDGTRFEIHWVESGGPAVAEPEHKGFGSRMIERALALQFGGAARQHFLTEGLRCEIIGHLGEADQGAKPVN